MENYNKKYTYFTVRSQGQKRYHVITGRGRGRENRLKKNPIHGSERSRFESSNGVFMGGDGGWDSEGSPKLFFERVKIRSNDIDRS